MVGIEKMEVICRLDVMYIARLVPTPFPKVEGIDQNAIVKSPWNTFLF